MKIGVDLRALQIGHQYRGIGEVVKRTLDGMFPLAVKDGNEFIFYVYDNLNDPLGLLTIPADLAYQTVSLGAAPVTTNRDARKKVFDALAYLYGNPITLAKQCDIFLQYDYALGVPTNTKTVLIKHDIIPFVFWDQFFESPMVPFKNKAARTTVRTAFHNYRSKRALVRALRNATKIITVSEYTRQDIHKRFATPLKKMQTIHLGVSLSQAKNAESLSDSQLPTKPYLLFIGAVDRRRRRVDELIAAYNNLKADGHDIQLVLVGENFQSASAVPQGPVRDALQKSSYKDDILTLGYVNDTVKQRLFREAIAFVFPSIYEGFGIPILEAMLLGCPVIAYKNSSIPEVGGSHALYATGWEDIQKQVKYIRGMTKVDQAAWASGARLHAERFSWSSTARDIYQVVTAANQ